MNAAERLLGLDLPGGWKVVEKLNHQGTSGGHFSVPYLAKDRIGKLHFLKAFDFSTAFQPGVDVVKELHRLTAAFEHERDILELCKSRHLSGVVVAITHGYVQVPNMPPQEGTVYYLIFELADSDVRRQVDKTNRLDLLWCLYILDDVALGLLQVHREAIAHQDLKPSNVLIYGKTCRVGDFGRSSRKGRQIWMDDLHVAGDTTYAPPELLYSYIHPDFVPRRMGCDLYLLGNLAAFLLSGVNVTAALFARLPKEFHPRKWGGTYEQALHHLVTAFDDTVTEIAQTIDPIVRDDIVAVIRELCTPDLARRGHPRGIGTANQYSLERYKSRFDLLLKTAEVKVRAKKSA